MASLHLTRDSASTLELSSLPTQAGSLVLSQIK
jgi:hypothetical protein